MQTQNDPDQLLMPTMLEVEQPKKKKTKTSRTRRPNSKNLFHLGSRPTIRTEGLSGSSLGALINVQAAPEQISNMYQVDLIQKQTSPKFAVDTHLMLNKKSQEQIIYDINKAFVELKDLFPAKKPIKRLNCKKNTSKKQNTATSLANDRSQNNSATKIGSKTQQVTSREREDSV